MVTKEKDEELSLFLEMRSRDNDKDNAQNDFQNNYVGVDASIGTFNPRGSSVSMIPIRKTAAEKFLDSENLKSDYDWLLAPPSTPSLAMESQKTVSSQNGMSNAHGVALTPRLTNIQEEPASRTSIGSKRITLPSSLNASISTNRRPSTSATRPLTPTKTGRLTNPTSKSAARSSTPTRQMSTPAMVSSAGRQSSSVKSCVSSTSNNPMPSRGNSPAIKSRPWKPNEMPGFSLDAPPNLRTSLPERPASVSRGRLGGANAQSSCVETGSKGRPRRQSCSPARGKTTNSAAKSRTPSYVIDDVNPVLMGTQMVERVVNMRKLAPPKQDYQHSTSNVSSGLDSTGFGRTLSKKSLDMAMRHMDIRRSVPGKQRPLTSIPASSVYSVRSGGSTKSKLNSSLDSPHVSNV